MASPRFSSRSQTFGEAFYLETRNPFRRAWRNVRLLAYIARVVWTWAVPGGRVRRAVRRARRGGRIYEIDHLGQ